MQTDEQQFNQLLQIALETKADVSVLKEDMSVLKSDAHRITGILDDHSAILTRLDQEHLFTLERVKRLEADRRN